MTIHRPLRPCLQPGCPHPMPCAAHTRKPFATAKAASTLYATPRWKRLRAAHLAQEPRCRTCGAPAKVVDHVEPHRGNEAAFWGGELQSLCWADSNSKTGREIRQRAAAHTKIKQATEKGSAPLRSRWQHGVIL